MRDTVAERLLARVLRWAPGDVARERPDLQALAALRYDEYQQFSPGMRFVESLALWLSQFERDDERKSAFEFVKSRLVFISSAEMKHLISMAFPDVVRPFLLREAAAELKVRETHVTRLAASAGYNTLLRRSLFLGLSDGAHTDIFRRNSVQISNEQVWQTYEISEEKARDMLSALVVDLEKLLKRKPKKDEERFRLLFLLDDFSGSGLSYIRKDPETGRYGGKVAKVIRSVAESEGALNSISSLDQLCICVLLYAATESALSHIRDLTSEYVKDRGLDSRIEVSAVETIPSTVAVTGNDDSGILSIAERYFDAAIVDDSYRIGRHQRPYLGFDEGGLPVVLYHNTPNNSLPILWFDERKRYRGLFPRVSRHRREP